MTRASCGICGGTTATLLAMLATSSLAIDMQERVDCDNTRRIVSLELLGLV